MTDIVQGKHRMPPPGATTGHDDMVEAAGHPVGGGLIKPDYGLFDLDRATFV